MLGIQNKEYNSKKDIMVNFIKDRFFELPVEEDIIKAYADYEKERLNIEIEEFSKTNGVDKEIVTKLLTQYFINEKSDMVMGSHYWNLDNDKVKVRILHECDNKSDLININPLLNEQTFNMTTYYNVAPWGKIFNKKLLMDKNIRFLEDSLSEDAYFYYKTLLNTKRITLLPNEILYNYNVIESNNSIIHSHNLKTFNNFLKGTKEVINLFNDCEYGCKQPVRASMYSLLLLFSNLSLNEKKDNIQKLYEFEKSINEEIYITLKELKIMNNQILKHHFTRAIIISEIYSKLYNNTTIKKLYRKFR